MCKADVWKGLEDGLAMRMSLSEPREIYKDKLETDNRSNVGSEFNFEIDLPGKRDRSTIYRLNLIKLYRRKPALANLVMERFLPDPGTIVLRQKDINLVTGKSFRIKTCCLSQMLINSLREDTEHLLDLGVSRMGQSNRTLPVVWLGRVNRYPYPRIKCIKYRNLNQCCVKGILRTGGVMDKCVQMFDKELWRLGPDGSGVLCANRTREVKRDFCDLPMRRNERRVVNTPLVFKRVLFQGRREKVGRGGRKESGENGRKEKGEETAKEKERESGRERVEPALYGEDS
ncbi:uncharacterized protein TNCV_1446021 [Trichonephila clavipes]|nr:uncharacterized protein TNCV_1446021 [Trichonephila clavipes]